MKWCVLHIWGFDFLLCPERSEGTHALLSMKFFSRREDLHCLYFALCFCEEFSLRPLPFLCIASPSKSCFSRKFFNVHNPPLPFNYGNFGNPAIQLWLR